MNLAYLILAHGDPNQLIDLVSYLSSDSRNIIVIHIDAKNQAMFELIRNTSSDKNNVILVKNRVTVNWSGFSMVKATLIMLQKLNESKFDFNYVCFISGQCHPIKSNNYINLFFEKNNGKEFLDIENSGCYDWRLKKFNFFSEFSGNRSIFFRALKKLIVVSQFNFIRNNFEGFKIYKGSSWFCISKSAANYILKFLHNNQNYIKNFNFTACADEHFFQIILMNSDFKKQVTGYNLTYVDWSNGNSSPRILVEDDCRNIQKSDKLFARKFSSKLSKEIFLHLDVT